MEKREACKNASSESVTACSFSRRPAPVKMSQVTHNTFGNESRRASFVQRKRYSNIRSLVGDYISGNVSVNASPAKTELKPMWITSLRNALSSTNSSFSLVQSKLGATRGKMPTKAAFCSHNATQDPVSNRRYTEVRSPVADYISGKPRSSGSAQTEVKQVWMSSLRNRVPTKPETFAPPKVVAQMCGKRATIVAQKMASSHRSATEISKPAYVPSKRYSNIQSTTGNHTSSKLGTTGATKPVLVRRAASILPSKKQTFVNVQPNVASSGSATGTPEKSASFSSIAAEIEKLTIVPSNLCATTLFLHEMHRDVQAAAETAAGPKAVWLDDETNFLQSEEESN